MVAATYALPNTTRFLLARGADQTCESDGISAIEAAVKPRVAYHQFRNVFFQTYCKELRMIQGGGIWNWRVGWTEVELLHFGRADRDRADPESACS